MQNRTLWERKDFFIVETFQLSKRRHFGENYSKKIRSMTEKSKNLMQFCTSRETETKPDRLKSPLKLEKSSLVKSLSVALDEF